ncbi:23S rRNA (guanosine(2251)-2'-O)-methyltransferase RlmB [Enorma burkinafasonensis]|uniref:23S rRNA (guanosine(2251)-2'-O)-methyltransferase RlmB n=1 Tax=Enorma burkinafasonensis TaxID=2590867 RepID=UPI0011A5335E|nr:23S rRNA (guanosine(2251)-2'-O)-methyltransferase RlmB [Enorma burkinafasonensis]
MARQQQGSRQNRQRSGGGASQRRTGVRSNSTAASQGARGREGTAPAARERRGRTGSADGAQSARPASRPAGSFIEGRRAAAEALRTGFPVKRALVAEGEDRDAALAKLVADVHAAGIPVLRAPRAELDALSSHGAHQGIALEVGAFPYAELSDVIARAGDGPALVVVLDHVTDAGNFGAIVRSAEVVGAAGVVIASRRAAEVTVATYKTSAGAVMHLPIAQVPNIARALEELKSAGFWAVGASEHAEGICWDMSLSGRIALVMGSEGDGLSRLVLETCDDLTKLPQHGKTESLNVAQAATALCYEWLRQNRA